MPFDGNGNFTPATSPGYPAIAGTPILADQFNNVILDIATGLGNAVTRDGQSPATANLSMGSNRLTNLADATSSADAVNFKQLALRGDFLTGVGGSADAITATANAGVTAYTQGLTFRFIAVNNNTAGTTINVNGIGAVSIRKENNQTLVAGDIIQNSMYQITYNGTQFQITNSSVNPTALQNGRYVSYTTAGTAPAYTVDAVPDYSVLTLFQRMTVRFHSANAGGACTLTVDAGLAKSIKVFIADGSKINPTFPVNFLAHLVYDGTDWIITNPIAPTQTGELFDWPVNTLPSYGLFCDGSAVSSATYPALFDVLVKFDTVTITIATPGVITWTGHALYVGAPIKFVSTGSLPTGLTVGTTYYVIAAGFGANSFQVSATLGGAAINTSGTQSGVHTGIHAPYGCANDLTTFNTPNIPALYTTIQVDTANLGFLGQTYVGENLSHNHLQGEGNAAFAGRYGQAAGAVTQGLNSNAFLGTTAAGNLTSTNGGSANLAAGVRVRKCIRF